MKNIIISVLLTISCTTTWAAKNINQNYCNDAYKDVLKNNVETIYDYFQQDQFEHNITSKLKGIQIIIKPQPWMSKSLLGRSIVCNYKYKNIEIKETDTNYIVIVKGNSDQEVQGIISWAGTI